MKLTIGVTVQYVMDGGNCYYKLHDHNINAIAENGAIPIMLPLTRDKETIEEYLGMVDGIYLTGGHDIWPLLYGSDPIKQFGIFYPERDEFEISLCRRAAELDMPILGVCRGHEIMNVAAGGTLYQDIYCEREKTNGHSPKGISGSYPYHRVSIKRDTMLYDIFKVDELAVNSFHHQAISSLASGFQVGASAKDGIIEAIESTEATFAIGLQWHPEDMYESLPQFSLIYKALISAAMAYSRTRRA